MSEFLTGDALIDAVDDIIWEAQKTLIIACPYIKLDSHFKKIFEHNLYKRDLHVLLIFGKNEGATYKSLSKRDLEFFTQFLNISIVYVPQLHAKYYANEQKGVVTSINLYSHSFENNIEFGVLFHSDNSKTVNADAGIKALRTCIKIAQENIAIYIKRPAYFESSANGTKEYLHSEVLLDKTDKYYKYSKLKPGDKDFSTVQDFPSEIFIDPNALERPKRKTKVAAKKEKEKNDKGYCIRTGERIPFNPNRPMTYDSYSTWAAFENWDFPEKYCHKTGKPSNGKTSMRKPVL
ncbi:MAG: hypothetical protein CL868_14555 [Cytophagaceae bacterium]|nr:hypothetical protein [Cytophagaceae bacterium]|tara:strand:- start:6605 stop:7480 length:876 start_codon:yes stop_codon:yes gene_type:complete